VGVLAGVAVLEVGAVKKVLVLEVLEVAVLEVAATEIQLIAVEEAFLQVLLPMGWAQIRTLMLIQRLM
jgi:hypothetical protein